MLDFTKAQKIRRPRIEAPPHAKHTEELAWSSRKLPRYVHQRFANGIYSPKTPQEAIEPLIIMTRDAGDPTSTAEKKTSAEEKRACGDYTQQHLWVGKKPVEEWRASIVEKLSDGEPRTFNRLMVELIDKTADICSGSTPEWAIWELVRDGVIEHTTSEPIFFKIRDTHNDQVEPAGNHAGSFEEGEARHGRR